MLSEKRVSESYVGPWPVELATFIAKCYLKLAPAYPGEYRVHRKPLERAWMEYNDEKNGEGFIRFFFPDLDLKGKDVLDLGCGYGGRTVHYGELGAGYVAGNEVRPEAVEEGAEFARFKNLNNVEFFLAPAEKLPFADDRFDIVLSSDVFEHVENFEQSLRESLRVLKPGGTLYAVFPPFYNATGGSHLHGFVSLSPAPNLLFSSSVLRKATEEILVERGYDLEFLDPWRPSDKLWCLNGVNISSFRKTLRNLAFSSISIKYAPLVTNLAKHPFVRRVHFVLRAATYVPLLREVMVGRIIAIISK
jgi:SAM-dependent methyltransferase